MPRKLRVDIIQPKFPNHLISRGNNRRRLFSYSTDYKRFLALLGRANLEHGCSMNAIAVMANHIHDLKTPPSVDAASKNMKSCLQKYARYRNDRRKTSGKLFEQRFFSKPVLTDEQLAATTCYIEANPLRAGMVDDPLAYPWTTYALHAGYPDKCAIPERMWTPSPWYLGLGPTRSQRAVAYRELFSDYQHRGVEPEHADLARQYERASSERYTRRLRRPDNSRASEPIRDWAFGLKTLVTSDLYDPGE